MSVKVLFFGVLTDIAGTDCRFFENVLSTGDLLHRIQDDYPEIIHYNFRIALNGEILIDDSPLSENDEISLLPPFAGG